MRVAASRCVTLRHAASVYHGPPCSTPRYANIEKNYIGPFLELWFDEQQRGGPLGPPSRFSLKKEDFQDFFEANWEIEGADPLKDSYGEYLKPQTYLREGHF